MNRPLMLAGLALMAVTLAIPGDQLILACAAGAMIGISIPLGARQ